MENRKWGVSGTLNRLIVKCEFITPAFIYGANDNLELRSASIKGAMRFWWRATSKYNDCKTMFKEESDIFGGAYKDDEEESVFKKAKVNIIVKYDDCKIDKNSDLLKLEFLGINYLYYSTLNLNGKRNNYHLKAGNEFQVIFEYSNENSKYIYEYLKALNALQLFGGVGSRSRRCGGNFVVKNIENLGNIKNLDITLIKEALYTEELYKDKKITDCYSKFFEDNLNKESIYRKSIVIATFKDEKARKKLTNSLNRIGDLYKEARGESKKGPSRGCSPLIIKMVKDKDEYKILLLKLEEKLQENDKNRIDRAWEIRKELIIADTLFSKLKGDFLLEVEINE